MNLALQRDDMERASAEPVLASKVRDAGEFSIVISNNGTTERECLSSNKEIVASNGRASLLQSRAQSSVRGICRYLERQDFKCSKHRFELEDSFGEPFFVAP
jgi:hypothetical protein